MISYLTGSAFYSYRIFLPLLVLSALFSVFYFIEGRKKISRSLWSPAGTELLLYLIYLILSLLVISFEPVGFIIAASAAGVIFVVMSDLQYSVPDKRMTPFFHSGQNLLTVLIIVSFLSGLMIPFIFIAAIKLFSGIYFAYRANLQNLYFKLRILRIVLLLAAGISLITRISFSDPVITVLFLSGELLDRIIYYQDLETKYRTR